MNLLELLGGIFGGEERAPQRPTRRAYEDDLPVYTPQGTMPLNAVQPGQEWQNPQNGFSPTGYTDPRRSMTPGINGAVNPLRQQYRSGRAKPYSPGVGPRTLF